jgi:hypothetical protein
MQRVSLSRLRLPERSLDLPEQTGPYIEHQRPRRKHQAAECPGVASVGPGRKPGLARSVAIVVALGDSSSPAVALLLDQTAKFCCCTDRWAAACPAIFRAPVHR